MLYDPVREMIKQIKLTLIVILYISICHPEVIEDRSGQGLVNFPHNIPADTTWIILDKNSIVAVDYIEPLPNLEKFTLKKNSLLYFPSFLNVTGLKSLDLRNNKISVVPYDELDALVLLEIMYMNDNLLVSFPDPPGPSSTLTTLQLRNNKLPSMPKLATLGRSITSFAIATNPIYSLPTDILASYPAIKHVDLMTLKLTGAVPDVSVWKDTLKRVRLGRNDLTTLDSAIVFALSGSGAEIQLEQNSFTAMPSFYHQNRTGLEDTEILLANNPIVCDCHSKWLKLAQMEGTPVIKEVTCASPAAVAGQKLSDLSLTNLSCSGMIRRPRHTLNVITLNIMHTYIIITHTS